MLEGFAIGVATCIVVSVFAFVLRSKMKTERNALGKMELSTKRLQTAISELMSRADELDQESKFLADGLRPDLSKRLAKACEDLVLLGDAVGLIEARISRQEFESAKDDLLISLGAANKISDEINEIRQEIRQKRLS